MTPPIEATSPPPKRNRATLVVSVILGVCALGCVVLMAGLAAFFVPAINQMRQASRRNDALGRMKGLSIATLSYAAENDGRLPVAATWMDGLAKYDTSSRDFRSPGLPRRGPFADPDYGIAFMKSLSSKRVAEIDSPADHVVLFDSTLMTRNAVSGLETVPKPPRFGKAETGGNVFAFADGHVRLVSASAALNLK